MIRRSRLLIATATLAIVGGCGQAQVQGTAARSAGGVPGWSGLVGTPRLYYVDRTAAQGGDIYALVFRVKSRLIAGGGEKTGSIRIQRKAYTAPITAWGYTGTQDRPANRVCYVAVLDDESHAGPPAFPQFDRHKEYEVSFVRHGKETPAVARVNGERLTKPNGAWRSKTTLATAGGPAGCSQAK